MPDTTHLVVWYVALASYFAFVGLMLAFWKRANGKLKAFAVFFCLFYAAVGAVYWRMFMG